MKHFFCNSDLIENYVTKLLHHIRSNSDLTWDEENSCYFEEECSYAKLLNELIVELGRVKPPKRYHDNEDVLAEYARDDLRWGLVKVGNKWKGADYGSILEQGSFSDEEERNLVLAASGRIRAAIHRNQMTFDEMEESHRKILGDVIASILYHRGNRE